MPSRLPGHVRERLNPIRMLILDVDGVLTDGSLYYSSEGEEIKRFSVRDGLAIRMLLDAGISVAIITGRSSKALAVRCSELGLDSELVIQGSRHKEADLVRLMEGLELTRPEIAVMGDDLPDLPILEMAGCSACPSDAVPEVIAACDVVCGAPGGRGAVRELAELLLKAQRRWQDGVGHWLGPNLPREPGDP
jgi:3-deoxy-D-manno-octulosonate 8-phosphate phosphatase (KDO 8-P phosphatase)